MLIITVQKLNISITLYNLQNTNLIYINRYLIIHPLQNM